MNNRVEVSVPVGGVARPITYPLGVGQCWSYNQIKLKKNLPAMCWRMSVQKYSTVVQ